MKQTIKCQNLYLRSDAHKILLPAESDVDVVLDFSGVDFVSRTATDELYVLTACYNSVVLLNANFVVQATWNAVVHTHERKKVRTGDQQTIINCSTMDDVTAMFDAID